MERDNVLGLFAAPSRADCLRAISRAVLKVRLDRGLTYVQIAKALDCSPGTVENAANENTLLAADTLLRFGFFFPDEYQTVEALLSMKEAPALTLQDRLERVEAHLDAIRREAGEGPGLRAVRARVGA